MKSIAFLKNPIQHYAWGSHQSIAELCGRTVPTAVPEAELWMGAHPKASSRAKFMGQWADLQVWIQKYPEAFLGADVWGKFGAELPFLFKVLAVERPLSIQAHPDACRAQAGFWREEWTGLDLDAEQRNYRDPKHKPECICALTPFWALNGFRRADEIVALMRTACGRHVEDLLEPLGQRPNPEGLKRFFRALMTLEPGRQRLLIGQAAATAADAPIPARIRSWVRRLGQVYPHDMGVLAPLYLNLVRLSPGQAMYLPAGQLHAYLKGTGIELMANSDNVLRGGLTAKHVNVSELLRVADFRSRIPDILYPMRKAAGQWTYETPAREFVLSRIRVRTHTPYMGPQKRSVEIMLCTAGQGEIRVRGSGQSLAFSRGCALIVPAAVPDYRMVGTATLYKAAVPLGRG